MGLPNNLADVIAQARDGELGLIEIIKIGDLVVSQLTGLSAPKSLTPTRKPIEDGFSMTDAAVDEPRELNMDILLANPDLSVEASATAILSGDLESLTETWRDKVKQLEQMFDDHEVITIQTHDGVYKSMLITSIDPVYDTGENWNAFFASVSAIQIRIVSNESTGGIVDSYEEVYGEL